MADEFDEKVTEFAEKAAKTIEKSSRGLMDRFDYEKRKASIRSEIGHTARDLDKAYEKLGREFFDARENGKEFEDTNSTYELIRSKEKILELLHEKLTNIESQ